MKNKREQNHLTQKPSKKLIYDDTNHLNELIKEIVSLHKEDGYDKFEEISMYIKKKSQYKGNVKLYFDEEKAKGYVLYNINGVMEDLVTDYAMAQTNDIDFFNPKSRFLYGGIYLDGSRIVFFTTSEPTKTYVINEMMDKYELPKP